ncbi:MULTISPECIES: hypothetical protein [Sphingomonas]|jgi:hypothetical protein|uniref:Uncharacterized protein n=3 Tax=Sphingomonas TaxID=13687 RepID=A0A0A1W5P6_9SPHN|nr:MULTISPECIES: hypothetical protein [Sphingomonas]MBB4609682.1 hypothetical protein [Sphingomonas yabuuchiae]GAM00466.1 hypothetical protein SP5_034_00390 [Sphingomonas parapaucimobilis NBRC 15100]
MEPALARALADELVELTRSLADLAYELGSDPDTLRRHMVSIQAVDRITQSQLAIADILRSDAPVAARIDGVTLETLADRLRTRMAKAA